MEIPKVVAIPINPTSKRCGSNFPNAIKDLVKAIVPANGNVLLFDYSSVPSDHLQVDVILRGNSNVSDDSLRFIRHTPTSAHRQIISNYSTLKLLPVLTVGKETRGDILLCIAFIKGDIPSIEDILQNRTNSTVKDHHWWTKLHEACSHGHWKLVELLL